MMIDKLIFYGLAISIAVATYLANVFTEECLCTTYDDDELHIVDIIEGIASILVQIFGVITMLIALPVLMKLNTPSVVEHIIFTPAYLGLFTGYMLKLAVYDSDLASYIANRIALFTQNEQLGYIISMTVNAILQISMLLAVGYMWYVVIAGGIE